MYGDIRIYIFFILLFISCISKKTKDLEVLFEDVYIEIGKDKRTAPRNRMLGKIISHSKDTLHFYSRCSSCIEKGNFNSFIYIINNNDTIELGSNYTSKFVIPPLDTIDYQISFMLVRHATKKALQRPDSSFLFQYDSIFLTNMISSKIYYFSNEKDYIENRKIPSIIFRKAKNIETHFQYYKEYKFNNYD